MALAAHDQVDRIEQLIALTTRLSVLMMEETQALAARQLDASSVNWHEKEQLAHTYRLEMADLSKNPDQLVKLDQSLRRSLLKTTSRFQEILTEHSKTLTAMKEITEGLVQSIAKEVASEQHGPRGYGQRGQQDSLRASGIAINAKA